ncbi:MAG TPA: TIGR04255 family protein [Verrucomicrobiae bacterium]|nr:TIGR04255 family protein [Verrucomicrobiae bacterium]HVX86746.1 TIGR04255 family protein [Phycisphaerae bacterium]
MDEKLPSFKKPPLIETAISVQFRTISGLTNGHLGILWDGHFRDRYPKAMDAQPIATQTETFDEEPSRRIRLPSFRIGTGDGASRLQLISEDDQQMIQLQNGRLVFNWRKLGNGAYPRWEQVRPGFDDALHTFEGFLQRQGLARIEANQWEVTYVNHLSRGQEWDKPSDWPALLPGLLGQAAANDEAMPEAVQCGYHFVLPGRRGRLHIELYHGFTGLEASASEILGLQFTTRGPITTNDGEDLASGIELGHSVIVRQFDHVTGPVAHRIWERE